MVASSKSAAVILAGGSGTRFWPLSHHGQAKQYLKLLGDKSLLQQTWDRVTTLSLPNDTYVCTAAPQKAYVTEQLPNASLILEPSARNTGPAVLLSCLKLLQRGYSSETVVTVYPADHAITQLDAFKKTLRAAMSLATDTHGLVTLGIVPTFAHTGYGYIERGSKKAGGFEVSRFIEKPPKATAEKLLKTAKCYWNGGIFVWQLGAIIKAFETHEQKAIETLQKALEKGAIEKVYGDLPSTPIDKWIMEKAKNVFVVPAEMGWSDVGSWSALYDLKKEKKSNNVVCAEKSAVLDSNGCLIHAPGKTVAAIGVEDLIVVVEGDRILVCKRSADQRVRDAAQSLET